LKVAQGEYMGYYHLPFCLVRIVVLLVWITENPNT